MRSLAPGHPPCADGSAVLRRVRAQLDPNAPASLHAWVDQLLEAQMEHFPDTCYADYARLAADVWMEARDTTHPEHTLEVLLKGILGLYTDLGIHGEVRFRYAHDFLYGYDTAKWVKRTGCCATAAFSERFIDYMQERVVDIRQRIADGDCARYPVLPEGRYRNITRFDRSPKAEAVLWPRLREAGLLPFAAWEVAGPVQWLPDLHNRRAQCAAK